MATDDQESETISGIIKRDYLIFGIAMTVVSIGLTDGLYRGLDIPLWTAIPLGIGFWSAAEWLIYRKYRTVVE